MTDEQQPLRANSDPWKGDPNFMASLARGLEVLQAFTPQRRLMSVSQISQRTGIPRAAVRRCLYTLSKLGFVYAEDGKNFELRPRVLSLGHNWLGATPLASASQPVLRQLSQTLNESCSMAVLDGDDILYIARASASRIMTIDLHIGSRLPASTTSMGRVLLSGLASEPLNDYLARLTQLRYTSHTLVSSSALREELARVRQQGYAINDQELEIGLRSLAVPLSAPDGRIVAALNVGVHAGQVSADMLRQHHLPLLQEAAREISLLLRQ
ncbi:IclR family transcriptional regulator domain-containing protein [Pantoea allii]|uniref:Helix-turn-helix domain-containing protein n=1 Tax=Pantoea allii TaxID=574096 RepID=A0A2V2BP87_9GAMM|nr:MULTISPECIES: IclR family transcriptional regulator C-terminal domain-containing protein [Pantoea]MBW1215098.1 helix-turn-helix domain-containing protein [Pantoea allii]MBW1252203.1 helix-turn-helix domain-containing protein [Pantoea allii]MBW1258535.1 helix-turn-helix domain-containing protein [Pantoea allii]MBW1261483.1 helix-turn-helix domain-containing protein [Pantoea allii]MBW1267756.1 helix-turn-helix domain-containing protein [Pantoea allii]